MTDGAGSDAGSDAGPDADADRDGPGTPARPAARLAIRPDTSTALEGLARLEAPAVWRAGPGAAPRGVYLSVGEAELVVQDTAGATLSHWSLPALARLNPGERPARYRVDTDQRTQNAEELEIEEPEMIEALERVRRAVGRGRARPGRLRGVLLMAALAVLALAALAWLPGAVRAHAANVIPASAREEIGARIYQHVAGVTGPACAEIKGMEALEALKARIMPGRPARLRVVRDLPTPAIALPGDLILISDGVLLSQDNPDVAAGHVLAATTAAAARAPLDRYLDDMGLGQVVGLLTSGDIDQPTIEAHADGLLRAPAPAPPDAALRARFAEAGLNWGPWAAATGRPPAAEPVSNAVPALDDTAWQALRGICDA